MRLLRRAPSGHAVNAVDPAYGARLAVDHYGADLGLDLEQQTTLNRLQLALDTEPGARLTGGLGTLFAVTMQQFHLARALGASVLAIVLSLALFEVTRAIEYRVSAFYRATS